MYLELFLSVLPEDEELYLVLIIDSSVFKANYPKPN